MQDIRFSPMNPFTEWVEINREMTDFRVMVLNVTLDDFKLKIDKPFGSHVSCMIERFERTYVHLQVEFPWLFQEFQDNGPDLLEI